MYCIEEFREKGEYDPQPVEACIDGKWVLARPINWKTRTLSERIKEAWAVFMGKAEAITFYKQ